MGHGHAWSYSLQPRSGTFEPPIPPHSVMGAPLSTDTVQHGTARRGTVYEWTGHRPR